MFWGNKESRTFAVQYGITISSTVWQSKITQYMKSKENETHFQGKREKKSSCQTQDDPDVGTLKDFKTVIVCSMR